MVSPSSQLKKKKSLATRARHGITVLENSLKNTRQRLAPYTPQPVKPSQVSMSGSVLVSALGWGMFGSFLLMMIWSCRFQMVHLANSLDPQQMKLMKKIVKMRSSIFIWSIVIAFFPALWLTYNCEFQIGYFLFFLFLISTILYSVWPKHHYMINHLTTAEQASQWYAICMCMRTHSLTGFVLGLVSYLVIVYALTPYKERSVCALLN